VSRSHRDRPLSFADRQTMWFFIVVGAALVGWTAYAGIVRVVDVLNGRIDVPAEFAGTMADAPIGPDGQMREVELLSAFLKPETLSVAGTGALILEVALSIASIATAVGCLIAVTISVMRGRVFSKRNTVLVGVAGFAWLAGLAGVPFFGNMVANDAFRSISDGTFDNVIASVQLSSLFLAAFVVAMAASVFSIGERLQRETELLV
jgi:hypothetical protein